MSVPGGARDDLAWTLQAAALAVAAPPLRGPARTQCVLTWCYRHAIADSNLSLSATKQLRRLSAARLVAESEGFEPSVGF